MKRLLQLGLVFAIAAMVVAATPMTVFAKGAPSPSVKTVTADQSNQPVAAAKIGGLPKWVIEADPYVHVVRGEASVDAVAAKFLDPVTLANTKTALAFFNALPLPARQASYPVVGALVSTGDLGMKSQWQLDANSQLYGDIAPRTGEPSMPSMVSSSCLNGDNAAIYWWGIHIKFSECVTQLLYPGVAGIGVIIGAVGQVISTLGIVVLAAASPYLLNIAAVLGASSVVIWAVDTFACDNHGVSLDYGWFPGVGDSIGC